MDPHGVLKIADVNFDGVPDKISWREFLDGYEEFIDFGGGKIRLINEASKYESVVDIFRTGKKFDLKVAARPGAKLFGVGQAVRLLDGRKGTIQGFSFIFSENYKNEEIRAEVMIKGAKNLIDVYLLDIVPQKNKEAL